MKFVKRETCRHCKCRIKKHQAYMNFLLPKPTGEVLRVTMHGDCIERFNRLATSKEYSEAWEKKRRASLRREGVYVA